jgi:hypothetical protein
MLQLAVRLEELAQDGRVEEDEEELPSHPRCWLHVGQLRSRRTGASTDAARRKTAREARKENLITEKERKATPRQSCGGLWGKSGFNKGRQHNVTHRWVHVPP